MLKQTNIKFKRRMTVAGLAALAITFLAPWATTFAYGPARDTYTNEVPADHVTFNSITNNVALGDERNFVRIREADSGNKYGDEVKVVPGKEYEVYIYYHNNAASNLNASGKGIANNVRITTNFDSAVNSSKKATITAFINATDATPTRIWDEAYMTTDSTADIVLRYVNASATIHNAGSTNGMKLSTDLFGDDTKGEGQYIGVNKLDGRLPGCAEYSGYITYRLRAEQVGAKVTKTVSLDGVNFFENVTANSIVNNTGEFILEDGINFKDCVFNNVNVKGIVDVATGSAFGERYAIEGCTGVESYGIVTEGDRDYVNSTEKAETVIGADDLTVEVNVAANLTVTLKDADGNALVGKEITVSVDGVNSTVTTVEGGVATIPISYDAEGVHEYTLYFAGDETNYKESTKLVTVTVTKASEPDTPVPPTKVATKLAAAKVTATYNVAKKLVITLTADGKALANKKVTVKVGTISKTLTTNAKGQVSLNVATLVPKTYTATVKFAGDNDYLASSVSPKVVVSKAKPKITAKAKTFKVKVKTKKYTVTLKNNKGKVMKKVKLTLKVGKKTYKATTNSKGKATFKITKLTKKGKYTATVKFAGSKYYKALSKKVKITVKK